MLFVCFYFYWSICIALKEVQCLDGVRTNIFFSHIFVRAKSKLDRKEKIHLKVFFNVPYFYYNLDAQSAVFLIEMKQFPG